MGYEKVVDDGDGKLDWIEAELPTESGHKHGEGK
jgi:hypothetical protein